MRSSTRRACWESTRCMSIWPGWLKAALIADLVISW